MKKFIATFYSFLFLATAPALAQLGLDEKTDKPSGLPSGDLKNLVTGVSNVILAIIGVVAILFIIIGAFQYVASAGNPESIGKAKTTILYAVIGLIVAILAFAVVNFIITGFMTPK